MKELEVKEKELAMQVRLKELKASAAPLPRRLTNTFYTLKKWLPV